MAQLRIGVIGVSGRGGLWRHWHQPDGGRSIVVAGADVRPDYLEQFRAENGSNPFITTDYQALLTQDDVDAVAVCSPDFCHEEHAVAVLESGKHLFLEKPMAITTEGCDRILNAWRASGKRMMIGFNMRYMNIFRVMKEIADSGAIGEIMSRLSGNGGNEKLIPMHPCRTNGRCTLERTLRPNNSSSVSETASSDKPC